MTLKQTPSSSQKVMRNWPRVVYIFTQTEPKSKIYFPQKGHKILLISHYDKVYSIYLFRAFLFISRFLRLLYLLSK